MRLALVSILTAAAAASCGRTTANCDPAPDAIPVSIKSISAGSVSTRSVTTLARLNRELRTAICQEQRLRLVTETDTSLAPRAVVLASVVFINDSVNIALRAVDPITSEVVYSLAETGPADERKAQVTNQSRVFVRSLATRLRQ